MRAEGIYDVDANTSIDQLSEDLNIKMPEVSEFAYVRTRTHTHTHKSLPTNLYQNYNSDACFSSGWHAVPLC